MYGKTGENNVHHTFSYVIVSPAAHSVYYIKSYLLRLHRLNKTLQEIPQLDGERIQPYPILAYTKKPKNQYAAEIVLTQSEDPFSTLQAENHSGSSTPGIAIEVNDFW